MQGTNKNSEYKFSNSDLQSSIKSKGKYVTQIIHFVGGEKRTYDGIDVNSIRQGQFTKFMLRDGRMIMINDANVLLVEVFPEKVNNE